MARSQPLTFRQSIAKFASNDKFLQNRVFNRLGGQALRYVAANRTAAKNRRLAGIPRHERERLLLDEGITIINNFLPPDIFETVKAENAYSDEDSRLRKAGPDMHGVVLYNANISAKTHSLTIKHIIESDEVRRLMEVFDGIVDAKSIGQAKMAWGFERNVRVLHDEVLKAHSASRVSVGNFHLDSFMPITKARYTLNEMTEANGAFTFCRGTHKVRLSTARFHFINSIDPVHYADNLFTTGLPDDRLDALSLKPELITCPANSLIIANTSAFHRPGHPSKVGEKRDCITIDRRPVGPSTSK